uniref:Uncharacterized protein n=1 Tax=Leersia perrieri TaxID=77586 RepID=A0A0D9WYK5_9ORYZ
MSLKKNKLRKVNRLERYHSNCELQVVHSKRKRVQCDVTDLEASMSEQRSSCKTPNIKKSPHHHGLLILFDIKRCCKRAWTIHKIKYSKSCAFKEDMTFTNGGWLHSITHDNKISKHGSGICYLVKLEPLCKSRSWETSFGKCESTILCVKPRIL